jgi:hypothetical protein
LIVFLLQEAVPSGAKLRVVPYEPSLLIGVGSALLIGVGAALLIAVGAARLIAVGAAHLIAVGAVLLMGVDAVRKVRTLVPLVQQIA